MEQYCDIFRGLLLEEIFATLASTLNDGGRGGGDLDGEGGGSMGNPRGRGGGGPSTATLMRVFSFSEPGAGGFSHVTLAVEEGGGGDGGGHGGGYKGGGAGGPGGGRGPGAPHG